jgi:hypothetical protein
VYPGTLPETSTSIHGVIRLSRRMTFPLIAVGVLAGLMITTCGPSARWMTRSRGEHLTRAEVNGRVQVDIPEGASDVRFYQHRHPESVVAADFPITEGDFLI